MSKNTNLIGGLFDGRGKPQPLRPSAKAKKIVTPEKQIQAAFFAWKKMNQREFPILRSIFSVPNGIWTFKSMAAEMVRQGLTAGIQDVICLAPSHCGKYHALLVEFKNETGEQSEEQIFFDQFFASLNYRTEVCRNWWTAAQIVNEHLNLKIPVYPK